MKRGADAQVRWSFHLHIKCYLVSYRAQTRVGGVRGRQLLLERRDGAMWLKTELGFLSDGWL